MLQNDSPSRVGVVYSLGLSFALSLASSFAVSPPATEAKEKKKPTIHITEEVYVVAKEPELHPQSSTVSLRRKDIETTALANNLSNVLDYAPGTYVSKGTKNESNLQIRGLNSGKIALLYDGVPIYEPYFGSFDLDTIIAEEVESIKIVRGATSVLYGPNVLGGAVNVLTRRPDTDSFAFTSSYGSFDEAQVSSTGTLRRGPFGFVGSFSHYQTDEYEWKNAQGDHVLQTNSDSESQNLTGKFYLYPGNSSEIMAELGYTATEYGIPWATDYYRPRYWRFSDWDRYLASLGGTFPLARRGYLKARAYYVGHHNVLDAYTTSEMDELDWISTFNNYSYGAFATGSLLLSSRHELKFTANAKHDQAKTQDDLGNPWERFSQETFSMGVEDHICLSPRWNLLGGVSLDYLVKEKGNNKTAANPLVGVGYRVSNDLDLRLSVSEKSRFPTMKDLYSSHAGNPDLRDERGTNWEMGFHFDRDVQLSGAVFHNRIDDIIQSIRTPEGWRVSVNIDEARISGLELSLQKAWEPLRAIANYTFLDSENPATGRPLSYVPKSQFNLILDYLPARDWKISLWGIAVSRSETDYNGDILEAPGYFLANASISKLLDRFEPFFKVENLLDKAYVTEVGFPMRARTLRVGLKLRFGSG